MSIVVKRAIAKQKKTKARRKIERECKYIIDDFGPIDKAFDQHGMLRISNNVADEDKDDTSSVSSFSTTATMDNNPGAGLSVDKYFYQPVGRKLEKIASRIVKPFFSPDGRIHDAADEYENDCSSVSSYSTTATMDDNPGAGLSIDKYFYQPVGRKIEKIAFRIAMPLLPPGSIFRYMEKSFCSAYLDFSSHDTDVHDARMKSVFLTGLNSLLHQTQ